MCDRYWEMFALFLLYPMRPVVLTTYSLVEKSPGWRSQARSSQEEEQNQDLSTASIYSVLYGNPPFLPLSIGLLPKS